MKLNLWVSLELVVDEGTDDETYHTLSDYEFKGDTVLNDPTPAQVVALLEAMGFAVYPQDETVIAAFLADPSGQDVETEVLAFQVIRVDPKDVEAAQ